MKVVKSRGLQSKPFDGRTTKEAKKEALSGLALEDLMLSNVNTHPISKIST